MNKRHRDEENSPLHAFDSSLAFEGFMEQARRIIPGETLDASLTRFQEEAA